MSPVPNIRPVLVVTGAAFEARIAAGDGVCVICSGGDPSRLRSLLDALDADDFRAVISFGLAGGLDPALRPGDLVIASRVTSGGRTWHATLQVGGALASALNASETKLIDLAGADAILMDPAGKAGVRAATGASAVDMESHVAAQFATGRKLPWASLRVICDPAERALPPLAMQALKPDGRIDFPAVLKNLARDPLQVPALVRTGLDTAIAIAALRRARRVLGPGLGLGPADLR